MENRDRPSHKELTNKIRLAKEAAGKQIYIIEDISLTMDSLDLGYDIHKDLHPLVSTILDEIKPEHYEGSHPPDKSYEEKIKGCDLFAFKYFFQYWKVEIYFKFALAKNGEFWLVSLHKDRPL